MEGIGDAKIFLSFLKRSSVSEYGTPRLQIFECKTNNVVVIERGARRISWAVNYEK